MNIMIWKDIYFLIHLATYCRSWTIIKVQSSSNYYKGLLCSWGPSNSIRGKELQHLSSTTCVFKEKHWDTERKENIKQEETECCYRHPVSCLSELIVCRAHQPSEWNLQQTTYVNVHISRLFTYVMHNACLSFLRKGSSCEERGEWDS